MAGDRRGIHTDDQIAELMNSVSAESINEYLQLMEETESPRPFHVWSLLSAVAALLGQNSELRLGATHVVRPNMFVVLIGPPAIRKSTPINQVVDLMQGTTVNFGPSDTGGQRHGLMSALTGLRRSDSWSRMKRIDHPLSINMVQPRRSSDMALFSPELGRLWGTSNREMSDFFISLFDAEGIDYETKAGSTQIAKPLVTFLGATTPSSFASMLPENAATHGILSRIVFVYGDTVHKHVPLPPDATPEWLDLRNSVASRLKWADRNRRDFVLDADARSAYSSLYQYRARLEDPRLESYQGRRGAAHLLKVAMCLAALRYDTCVIESDIRVAHELLCNVEPMMHKALESFGRNKAYQGRQIIIQFLRSKPGQRASISDVYAAASTEMNRREAEEIVSMMAINKEVTIYGGHTVILGKGVLDVIQGGKEDQENRK